MVSSPLVRENATLARSRCDTSIENDTFVLLVAQVRLRARLAETQQTIPDQVHKPTVRPTMRLSSFKVFEGIELLHVQTDAASLTIVLRLQPLHRLILALLGPLYEQVYNPSG